MDPKFRLLTGIPGKKAQVNVRLPEALRSDIEEIVKAEDTTITDLVTEGLGRVILDRVENHGFSPDALRSVLGGPVDTIGQILGDES